eukprot:11360-Heterococcus_DN1.PRE.1
MDYHREAVDLMQQIQQSDNSYTDYTNAELTYTREHHQQTELEKANAELPEFNAITKRLQDPVEHLRTATASTTPSHLLFAACCCTLAHFVADVRGAVTLQCEATYKIDEKVTASASARTHRLDTALALLASADFDPAVDRPLQPSLLCQLVLHS